MNEYSDLLKIVETGLKDVKSKFEAENAELRKEFVQKSSGYRNEAGVMHTGPGAYRDAGIIDMVAESAALKALASRQTKSAEIPLDVGIGMLRKSVIVNDTPGAGQTGLFTPPQTLPGIANDPRRSLRLLDILTPMQVTASAFEFNALNGYSNGADYQIAQGDVKAVASVPTQLVTANIATIAYYAQMSEQVLQDAPFLRQTIANLIQYGLLDRLERQLIGGTAGTGKITGLLAQATIHTNVATAPADRIGEAAAAISLLGWNPTAVILNPADWFAIRSERGTTGEYVARNGWDAPAAPNIWGMDLIPSAGMTAGTALVFDPAQTLLLDRQQAAVQFGYVDDGFIRNVLTLRAEGRWGLAVLAPSALQKVTLT